MPEPIIYIEAKDCLFFKNETVDANVIQEFIATQQKNIFRISNKRFEDTSVLAEYDYRLNKWRAGRYIGEAYFEKNNRTYKISIKPRFGEQVLFYMLENIFNIKITKSIGEYKKNDNWLNYIKRIIAFIWVQKLANANFHGLPKKKENVRYQGTVIKGRLAVRKSILPLFQRKQLVSISKQKDIHPTIANIILTAFEILKKDLSFDHINIPDTATDALNQFSLKKQTKPITANEFHKIKYNEIYLSWKPIVDFSWDIVNRKALGLQQNQDNTKKSYGFFMDMAEIWEQYLRTILRKNLLPHGWHPIAEKQIAYKGYFFQRELIPDLVFRNNSKMIVYDAKYKRMTADYRDVDRGDFFQIHTYIQNFVNRNTVKAGGLLYPMSARNINYDKYTSNTLMNDEGLEIRFSIDGIELYEDESNDDYKVKETQFINRIIQNL